MNGVEYKYMFFIFLKKNVSSSGIWNVNWSIVSVLCI